MTSHCQSQACEHHHLMWNFSSNVHAKFCLIWNNVHVSVNRVGEKTPISDHRVSFLMLGDQAWLLGTLAYKVGCPKGSLEFFLEHSLAFINKRYIKGVPFRSKWYIKGPGVGTPPRHGLKSNHLIHNVHKLSLWPVVLSRSYRPEGQDHRKLKILL